MTGGESATRHLVDQIARTSKNRTALWVDFLRRTEARTIAEIGVFRGEFAAQLLSRCPAIDTYYMVDPWQHLDRWNKPANRSDEVFAEIFETAMSKTQQYEQRRVVLRDRTVDAADRIEDASLDFAYIDGDHTLRGISTDLVCLYPKVRDGGWLGGDDFTPTIWQHGSRFEPTLVFPMAVHFAEAAGARIYGLPHNQFLIEKRPGRRFEFVDLTGKYSDLTLLGQLAGRPDHTGLAARALRRLRR